MVAGVKMLVLFIEIYGINFILPGLEGAPGKRLRTAQMFLSEKVVG